MKMETEQERMKQYPLIVTKAVKKYGAKGSEFWTVADATQKAYLEFLGSVAFETDEEGNVMAQHDEAYLNWYLDQTAKYETLLLQSREKPYWENIHLTNRQRKVFSKMNAFEARVVQLAKGYDNGEGMSPREIADTQEFDCPEYYVRFIVRWYEKMTE